MLNHIKTSTPPTAPSNPWLTRTPEEKAERIKFIVLNLLNAPSGQGLVERVHTTCLSLFRLFDEGKDLNGFETGVDRIAFCHALGAEGASVFNAFGAFVVAVNFLLPEGDKLPEESQVPMHRLPSGYVWPGDLKDMPAGWDTEEKAPETTAS